MIKELNDVETINMFLKKFNQSMTSLDEPFKKYVGFEIDGNYSLLESEVACDFSATFQSIVGTGKLSLIENDNEKIIGLNTIMKQTTSKDEWYYSNEMLDAVAVYRLDVDKLSCKAK